MKQEGDGGEDDQDADDGFDGQTIDLHEARDDIGDISVIVASEHAAHGDGQHLPVISSEEGDVAAPSGHAAAGDRAHRGAHRVEQRHAGKIEGQRPDGGVADIDPEDDFGVFGKVRDDAVVMAFGLEQGHGRRRPQDGGQQQNESHAPDELGDGAMERVDMGAKRLIGIDVMAIDREARRR